MKKRKEVFKHEIFEGREVPKEHKNIQEEIQQYHIQQTKHELADQIKQMHLRENALLKNEMKEKLSQLESLGTGALSQPKLLLAKNLGLMADEDL